MDAVGGYGSGYVRAAQNEVDWSIDGTGSSVDVYPNELVVPGKRRVKVQVGFNEDDPVGWGRSGSWSATSQVSWQWGRLGSDRLGRREGCEE